MSSFGSRSTDSSPGGSARPSSAQPAGRLGDQAAQLRIVAVLGQELAGALQIVAELEVFARQLVRGLELPVLCVQPPRSVPDRRSPPGPHPPLQLGEARLDLLNERFDQDF